MLTEQKLINGLKRGDMHAYEQAFHTYYPKFVHFANFIVNDFEVAKDLVQNVFLKVWHHRDRLDESLSLNNYLFVLTKREVLNHLRSQKAFESLETLSEVKGSSHRADDEVEVAMIRNQVNKLPEQRRNVFILSRYYGLPHKEIARQLDISEKTVERHITLAGKQLRDVLDELS